MNEFLKVVKVFSKAVKFWLYQQSLNEEKAKADLEKQADEYKAAHKKLTSAMEEAKSRSSAMNKRIDVLSRTNAEQKKELSDLHTRYCELVRQKRKLEELYSSLKESSGSNYMGIESVVKKSEKESERSNNDQQQQQQQQQPPLSRPRQNLFPSHSEFSIRAPQTPKMKPLNFTMADGVGFSPRRQESFSIFEPSAQRNAGKFSLSDLQQQQQTTTPRQSQKPGSPSLQPFTRDRFNVFKKRESRSPVGPSSSSSVSSSTPSSPRILPFKK